METNQTDGNDIQRYFLRQPRMHYHFSDELRMAVVGGDEEALMRMGAHLQACPDCQAQQIRLVEEMSGLATSTPRPGEVTPATIPATQPVLDEADDPMAKGPETPYPLGCAMARSAYFRFLEQDRGLATEYLYHLMTCEDCRTQLTDAALTRYTIEMHGEEELPAIG